MEREKSLGEFGEWPSVKIFDYSIGVYGIFLWDFSSSSRLDSLVDIAEKHVRWINVDSPYSEELLSGIGTVFHIRPLVIHNLRNQFQRAEVEGYDELLSVVTKMIYFTSDALTVEHTNILLRHNHVLTFGDTKGDVLEGIRRCIQADTCVHSMGTDHLAYLLLDAIVDGYFDVLEAIGGQIDDLEDSIMGQTTKQHLLQTRVIKKSLLRVDRHIWPLRNMASLVDKESSELIHPETEPYLRDVYNHTMRAIDSTETYHDLLSGLAGLYLSNISYRMNEIIKVLTTVSIIFIPLTFIMGVYGMNSKYMPELNRTWKYPVVWAMIVVVSIVMILFFKKKKWF